VWFFPGPQLRVFRGENIYKNNFTKLSAIHCVVPGIVDRCKLPRGSPENVENYIKDEICSIIFIQC